MDDQPQKRVYRLFALIPSDQMGQFEMTVLSQDDDLARIMEKCWQMNATARQAHTGMIFVVHPDLAADISELRTMRLVRHWEW